MTIKFLSLTGCLALAMTGLTGLVLAADSSVTTPPDDAVISRQDMAPLKDLRDMAADAANHAAELQSIARDPALDWQTHAEHIDALKNDINFMGRSLYQLQQHLESAAPLEKEAIENAGPLLRLMVYNIQNAMQFLNEREREFWLPGYQKNVRNLVDESERLSTSLDKVVQLSQVRNKEKHIEKDLKTANGY